MTLKITWQKCILSFILYTCTSFTPASAGMLGLLGLVSGSGALLKLAYDHRGTITTSFMALREYAGARAAKNRFEQELRVTKDALDGQTLIINNLKAQLQQSDADKRQNYEKVQALNNKLLKFERKKRLFFPIKEIKHLITEQDKENAKFQPTILTLESYDTEIKKSLDTIHRESDCIGSTVASLKDTFYKNFLTVNQQFNSTERNKIVHQYLLGKGLCLQGKLVTNSSLTPAEIIKEQLTALTNSSNTISNQYDYLKRRLSSEGLSKKYEELVKSSTVYYDTIIKFTKEMQQILKNHKNQKKSLKTIENLKNSLITAIESAKNSLAIHVETKKIALENYLNLKNKLITDKSDKERIALPGFKGYFCRKQCVKTDTFKKVEKDIKKTVDALDILNTRIPFLNVVHNNISNGIIHLPTLFKTDLNYLDELKDTVEIFQNQQYYTKTDLR